MVEHSIPKPRIEGIKFESKGMTAAGCKLKDRRQQVQNQDRDAASRVFRLPTQCHYYLTPHKPHGKGGVYELAHPAKARNSILKLILFRHLMDGQGIEEMAIGRSGHAST